MSTIKPDRKGSRTGKTARTICYILAIVSVVMGLLNVADDSSNLIPCLGAAVGMILLAMLFRVLACIAFNLETLAAVSMIDNDEETENEPKKDNGSRY